MKCRLRKAQSSKLKQGYGIYMVFADKKIVYAGRSSNLANRAATQLAKYGGKKGTVIGINATKYQARGLEQAIIESYDLIANGKNLINGISKTNTNAKQYHNALKGFLNALE